MSWGNPSNAIEKLLQAGMSPAAFGYGVGSYARTAAYAAGVLKRHQLNAHVISIGNITCGGTGKTPVAIDLANKLVAHGRRVCVLSRGFKRKSTDSFLVVSDGKRIVAECEESGDEPYLIAKMAPGAAVIVGADRLVSGNFAIQELKAEILLLDDGFQHVRLRRNDDLLLLDYNDDPDNDALLPAGRLREPLSAVGRASSVTITKVPIGVDQDRMAKITSTVRKYNKRADISFCQFNPVCIDDLKGETVVAMCGIARPDSFSKALETMGATVVKTVTYPDHHWFTQQDINRLNRIVKKSGASYLVTTAKDRVRMKESDQLDCRVSVLHQQLAWLGEMPEPIQKLLSIPVSEELPAVQAV